jgi:hypothetical protein
LCSEHLQLLDWHCCHWHSLHYKWRFHLFWMQCGLSLGYQLQQSKCTSWITDRFVIHQHDLQQQ